MSVVTVRSSSSLSYTARWTGPIGGVFATLSARSIAAGRPSGSITVQAAFVNGAEIEVGPKLWSRSSPTASPKLPVSPAKVTTTTGRLAAATLIS